MPLPLDILDLFQVQTREASCRGKGATRSSSRHPSTVRLVN